MNPFLWNLGCVECYYNIPPWYLDDLSTLPNFSLQGRKRNINFKDSTTKVSQKKVHPVVHSYDFQINWDLLISKLGRICPHHCLRSWRPWPQSLSTKLLTTRVTSRERRSHFHNARPNLKERNWYSNMLSWNKSSWTWTHVLQEDLYTVIPFVFEFTTLS